MDRMKRREFNRALAGLATTGFSGRTFAWEAGDSSDPSAEPRDTITDVPGIKVGHYTDTRRPTGCTAILFDSAVTAGVDYDSSTPGSFMGVRLLPTSLAANLNGMLLTGGGGFGLAAMAGLMGYLEEHHAAASRQRSGVYLPSVAGASIYDLIVGNPKIRPDANAAYQACETASSGPVAQGNVGAGAGATVGKMLKGFGGMKGGLGSASLRVGEVVIGALAVVNALGDIVDRHTGKILAGARRPGGKGFANIVETLKQLPAGERALSELVEDPLEQSTTLVVIATNATFSKPELAKIAAMGSTGAARVINPYHSTGDGDSTFAVSTNRVKWGNTALVGVSAPAVSAVGALAAETVSEAITRAILAAKSIERWPAHRDYPAD
jgi:L-aminopeptidase/D-esterase-like protein